MRWNCLSIFFHLLPFLHFPFISLLLFPIPSLSLPFLHFLPLSSIPFRFLLLFSLASCSLFLSCSLFSFPLEVFDTKANCISNERRELCPSYLPTFNLKLQFYFAEINNDQDNSKHKEALQLLFLMIPPENRTLLYHLLDLLNRIRNNPENKMTSHNLAVVFCPTILYTKKVKITRSSMILLWFVENVLV